MLLQGASTYGQINAEQHQAAAVRAQGSYEAAAYDRNAQIAGLQSADSIARGELSSYQKATQVRGEEGAARATLGASGVRLDTGTAVDVQSDIARVGALDEATIRNNAAREAWGYNVQQNDYLSKAALARLGSTNAAIGIGDEEISTLLTGAGKSYGILRQSGRAGSSIKSPVAARAWLPPRDAPEPDDGQ